MSDLRRHRHDDDVVCSTLPWSERPESPDRDRRHKREELARLEAGAREEKERVTWEMFRANSEALSEMAALFAQSEADRRRMAERLVELEGASRAERAAASQRHTEAEAIFERILGPLGDDPTEAAPPIDEWFLKLATPDDDAKP